MPVLPIIAAAVTVYTVLRGGEAVGKTLIKRRDLKRDEAQRAEALRLSGYTDDWNGWMYPEPAAPKALPAPKPLPIQVIQEEEKPLTALEIEQEGIRRGAEALKAAVNAMVDESTDAAIKKHAAVQKRAETIQEKKIDKAAQAYVANFLQKVDAVCEEETADAANS